MLEAMVNLAMIMRLVDDNENAVFYDSCFISVVRHYDDVDKVGETSAITDQTVVVRRTKP